MGSGTMRGRSSKGSGFFGFLGADESAGSVSSRGWEKQAEARVSMKQAANSQLITDELPLPLKGEIIIGARSPEIWQALNLSRAAQDVKN